MKANPSSNNAVEIITITEARKRLGQEDPQPFYDAIKLGHLQRIPDSGATGKKAKVLLRWHDVQIWWEARQAKKAKAGSKNTGNHPDEPAPSSPGTDAAVNAEPAPEKVPEPVFEPGATDPCAAAESVPEPPPPANPVSNHPEESGKTVEPVVPEKGPSRHQAERARANLRKKSGKARRHPKTRKPETDGAARNGKSTRPLRYFKKLLRPLGREDAGNLLLWLQNRLLDGKHRAKEPVATTQS